MSEKEQKTVIVARHGELENPREIVYNRDSGMASEDLMHLSASGRKQIIELGDSIKEAGLRVVRIVTSPQTRTVESANLLGQHLGGVEVIVNPDLDDVFAPGPYLERMLMGELTEIGGNVYEESRWGKYGHESPESIIKRMKRAVTQAAEGLIPGQAAVLVSHGDSIAWLLNTLEGAQIPDPQDLRNLIYPAKGEAAIVASEDDTFSIVKIIPERAESHINTY